MIDFSLSGKVVGAIIAGFCLPIYHIILLRICAKERYIKLLVIISFCITIITWLVLSFVLQKPAVLLGSFDETPLSPIKVVDGLLILGFFFIGYIEFYSLIRRGYSLRILLELYLKGSPMTPEEISISYSGERGLDYLLRRRLSGLINIGLIRIGSEQVQLTSLTGKIAAKTIFFIIKVLGIKTLG